MFSIFSVHVFLLCFVVCYYRMSQEENDSIPSPPSMVEDPNAFVVHDFIDPILAHDPSRRAKSNDPSWKYA